MLEDTMLLLRLQLFCRERNISQGILFYTGDQVDIYDALQYPIMFWKGEDGYQINIPHKTPNKTVSSMDFYASRIMIREGEGKSHPKVLSTFSPKYCRHVCKN
jgi:hypothetical protein